ncbi:MAG TPA: MMPL family transporter [Methanocella sp.]
MFREWGTFVTRHPYVVLAVWLIMLIISVPLALTFSDRLTYSMDSFIPKDLESIQAQSVYDARFPDAAQSQIIVAVKGDPGTAVTFVDRLNHTVNDGSLPNITGTSYVYEIQRETLANVSYDLHTGLHELYDGAYDVSRELYDATDEMANASRDLFDLRDNVTKINAQLSGAWGTAAGSSDAMYGLRSQIVLSRAGMYQINVSNPGLTPDQVIDAFMNAQGLSSPEDRAMMTAIYALDPNPSDAAVDALTLSFITAGMSSADAKNARALYAVGSNRDRIWEYVLDNALAGQTDATAAGLIRDAWVLGRAATNETFDKYVLDRAGRDMNESERTRLRTIYSWGPAPDGSVIRNYVLDEAAKDLNETGRRLTRDVYDLGRDAANASLQNYTVSRVNEDLGLTGNMSYLYALLDLDGNATKPQVESFAREWAAVHDLSNPGILPEAVVDQMARGNLTLFVLGLREKEDSQAATDAVVKVRDDVKAQLQQPEFEGLNAYVTGAAAMSLDAKTTSLQDMDNIDKISVVLILVLLCLYFRSVVTPLVPLLATGTGIVICFAALHLLTFALPLFYLILTLCVVIMLGAGTDYCVFTLSRYAEERALGRDVKASVIASVEHAGKSVASSGLTAMIGFSALLLVDQGIFGGIGVGIALGVLVSLFVALTLLPAVLTLAGDRLFWPRKLFNTGTRGVVSDIWAQITRAVLRRSKLILVLALLVCIPAVYFTLQIQLGNDYVANMAPGVESKQGFDAINDAFGSGTVDKVMVLMTLPGDARDASGNITAATLDRVESVSAMLAQVKGADQVYSMTRPDGEMINYQNLSSYPLIEREYYRTSMNDSLGNDDRTIALYTSFHGSPYSIENSHVIDHIRSNVTAYAAESGTNETFLIGGSPAGLHDYQTLVTGKYNVVYMFVLIGVFFVLMALLRSVFTPLRLILTLLASVVWTIAAYVVVFQLWGGMSTEWLLPIFLFCALMGLGVDYDIFLVSRIREEVLKGKSDEEAIETAVKATGTIITLCGAVMASAFGSMMISSSLELKEFGFVLCLAIILDATLMRLVIVPAIMVLMKKYNWWMPFVKAPKREVLVSEIVKK